MKKKGTELKDLTLVELQDKLRFNHTVSPIDNPMQLRTKKKDVARILTELRKRELAANTVKK